MYTLHTRVYPEVRLQRGAFYPEVRLQRGAFYPSSPVLCGNEARSIPLFPVNVGDNEARSILRLWENWGDHSPDESLDCVVNVDYSARFCSFLPVLTFPFSLSFRPNPDISVRKMRMLRNVENVRKRHPEVGLGLIYLRIRADNSVSFEQFWQKRAEMPGKFRTEGAYNQA